MSMTNQQPATVTEAEEVAPREDSFALIGGPEAAEAYKTPFIEGVKTMYTEYTGASFEGYTGFLLNDEANWDTWRTFAMIFKDWEFEVMKDGVAELMADNGKIEVDRAFLCKVTKGDEYIIVDGVKKLFSSIEILEHYITEKKKFLNTSRDMYYVDKDGKNKRTVEIAYMAGEPVFFKDLILDEEMIATIRTTCNAVFSKERARGFDGKFLSRKAGVLVYGPVGNGKTSLGKAISNEYNTSLYIVDGTVEGRSIEDLVNDITTKSRAVVLFEEFDKLLSDPKIVGRIQTLLDGVGDMDGVMFVANTNDIGSIPEAMTDRPGRFSIRAEFKNPNRDQRGEYFSTRIPEEVQSEFSDELLDTSDGFSFDKCREVVSRASSYHVIDKMEPLPAFKRSLREIMKEFKNIEETRKRGGL